MPWARKYGYFCSGSVRALRRDIVQSMYDGVFGVHGKLEALGKGRSPDWLVQYVQYEFFVLALAYPAADYCSPSGKYSGDFAPNVSLPLLITAEDLQIPYVSDSHHS